MIVIAKWGAPMVLASGILMALQGIMKYLKDFFMSLHKGATAVYSDNVPENGKNKDASKRIHVCLVPFEKLKREEQIKDYEAVEVLLEVMPVL